MDSQAVEDVPSRARARVLDVGNCDPDHAMIRAMLENHFAVEVERVMYVSEAREALRRGRYDLVLVNRLIFADQSEGLELVRWMKSQGGAPDTPVMLVSDREAAQAEAVAAGAKPGFGKSAVNRVETLRRLAEFLPAIRGVCG
jgi:DNA-binding response OmpR family regulator